MHLGSFSPWVVVHRWWDAHLSHHFLVLFFKVTQLFLHVHPLLLHVTIPSSVYGLNVTNCSIVANLASMFIDVASSYPKSSENRLSQTYEWHVKSMTNPIDNATVNVMFCTLLGQALINSSLWSWARLSTTRILPQTICGTIDLLLPLPYHESHASATSIVDKWEILVNEYLIIHLNMGEEVASYLLTPTVRS